MSSYCDYLIDLFKPWVPIKIRKMFGGYGVYRGEVMFSLIADDVLYFKVDATNRRDFELAESEPFTYEAKGKRVSLSYFMLPAEILEDQEQLKIWADKSYAVALRSKSKKTL